jgi:hypothetical protein
MWTHIRIVFNIAEITAGILVKQSREIAPTAKISTSIRLHIRTENSC